MIILKELVVLKNIFAWHIYIKKMKIEKLKDSLIKLRIILKEMEKNRRHWKIKNRKALRKK